VGDAMKVILFFGHHKVGSTALQSFFSQNYLSLLRAGILYPAVESEGFSDALKRALAGQDSKGGTPINVREPHNALAFRMMAQISNGKVPAYHGSLPAMAQMIRSLRQQVAALEPQTVVMCSEVMANFGAKNPELITRLRDIFPEAEFELYCTLRRPDEYLASWHGQRLKLGHQVAPLRDGGAMDYRQSIHFDYRKMLAPWAERMPEARLHLRNYSDVLAAGGSVEDFTQKTGLDCPDGLIAPARANQSLPYAVMEIMRRGNHALPKETTRRMRRFLLTMAGKLDFPPNGKVELFGGETRAALADAFEPIHDWLGELTGRQAFFPDLGEMRKTRPMPETEAVRKALDKLLRVAPDERPEPEVWAVIETLSREFRDARPRLFKRRKLA